MEQFLLKNAALYQKLVKATPPAPPPAKEETETNTPDMIVAARIRPLLDEDLEAGFPCAVFPRSNQAGVVDIHDLYNHPRGRPILKSSNYKVDRLFNSSTTSEQIYSNLVASLIPFACSGGLSTLFTYGQTGSGKTYTVTALSHLVSSTLFPSSPSLPQRKIHITIIDLAGQSAFDLLSSRKPISLLEDSFGVTQLAGAIEHQVSTKEEMMTLIDRATSFRKTETTFKNDASSRSHSICRIRISTSEPENINGEEGMLYLIDLAGSEAARDIATHGADRMKETREINISLSVLKDCIRGKVQADLLLASSGGRERGKGKKQPHIPFRQSALTKVLKHVFDPAEYRKCKTVVIACVNPSLADVGATRNTLRFAELLRVLIPKTSVAKGPMGWDNVQLRSWIGKNSGDPQIPPAILAPTESGAELLHLSETEFERRCLEIHGTRREQAKAVRAKLWQLHIDAQHISKGQSVSSIRTSSRELDPAVSGLGFKERIRSGMVVCWRKTGDGAEGGGGEEEKGLAVVLCPAEAVHGTNEASRSDNRRYSCALVVPGAMDGTYELSLWQQVTIEVGMMEKEVILEYDAGTRYYYVSV